MMYGAETYRGQTPAAVKKVQEKKLDVAEDVGMDVWSFLMKFTCFSPLKNCIIAHSVI